LLARTGFSLVRALSRLWIVIALYKRPYYKQAPSAKRPSGYELIVADMFPE